MHQLVTPSRAANSACGTAQVLLFDAYFPFLKGVAWLDSDKPLRSGWAWGQKYLLDRIAVAEAKVGKGKLLLFGPEITFRAQPHGTFKFMFNGIYYGAAESVKMN